MAYALVGTAGAITAAGASETPALGHTATANNLLIAWGVDTASNAAPATTSSGWAVAVSEPTTSTIAVGIFWKIAVGGETTGPTITGASVVASVAEFSGNATTSPVDQVGVVAASSSPVTATAGAVDAASGELLLYISACRKSGGGNTNTLTNALTNATQTDVVNIGANSATVHYAWGYGVTTAHAVADADAFSVVTTTNITGMTVAIASFKLAAVAPTLLPAQARGRHPVVHGPRPSRGRF